MLIKNVTETYNLLAAFLNDEIITWIRKCNSKTSQAYSRNLLRLLSISVEGYGEALNTKSVVKVSEYFEHYCIEACKMYGLNTARSNIAALKSFIRFMISEGAFSDQSLDELDILLRRGLSKTVYESYKGRVLPEGISSKFNFNIQQTLSPKKGKELSPVVEIKINLLATYLNTEVHKLISDYILASGEQKRSKISKSLSIYIKVLHEGLNSKDLDKITEVLSYVTTHISTSTDSLSVFNLHMSNYKGLMKHLANSNYFEMSLSDELIALLRRRNRDEFEKCKLGIVPDDFSAKIPKELSADEEFKLTLSSTCTLEIASRLEEHVNTFKFKKHHREPLTAFLKQISLSSHRWYEHPMIVQGELIKFRGDLLDKYDRNTAYGKFQNVKNSINVLISHGLLPIDIELPNNLRRCTNTEKIRLNNPLISNTNLYDERSLKQFSDSKAFLEYLEEDIEKNLDLLVSEAQLLVLEAYQKFCDTHSLIARSRFNEFINHPKFHVKESSVHKGKYSNYTVSAFHIDHPLRLENLVAYFNHFYSELSLDAVSIKKDSDINISHDALPYLGLTTNVASAMQTIITEEIGINPHSLYAAKVTSTGHGLEFIQVDDEGSVRIRTVKLRAKHARTRKASGSLIPLNKITVKNIDAASCLKMAIEMTSRAREVRGINNLWLCVTTHGITNSSPDSFQRGFHNLRERVAVSSEVINDATLKKVRASKGVLIYLKSNGDSLKTATYFGNTVKTTLNRYIPKYLTELVYRLKIRSFQRILLFMAVASDDSPFDSLRLSKDEFNGQLQDAFTNPEMGGNLFDKLTKHSKDNDTNQNIYFCVSDKNLKLAIKYALDGEDKKLKKMCVDVIQMISQTNTPLKLMLRKAQKAVE